jgi:outer membrane receptor protein involved in Fe transport
MNSRCGQRILYGPIAAGACLVVQAAPPLSSELHAFHIPPEDADSSITEFMYQSGIDIAAKPRDLKGIQTNAVSGSLSVDAALRLLLAGTALTFSYTSDGHGVVLKAAPAGQAPADPPTSDTAPPTLPSPDQAPQQRVVVLEDVVVTAQRRPQYLQEVPISVQFVPQASLAEANLTSLDVLSQTLPSVHVGSNSRSANLYIRGTGSGESQTFDQSVGIFFDDIYYGRARMSNAMLFDVERIEVLKGPQTTFFGNNAIAGALNVITRKPSDEFEGSVRTLYGEHGQYAAEGSIGGPVAASLSVRFAVLADGTDGWLHDVNLRRHVPEENNVGGRLTFLLKTDSDLEALLKVGASKNRNSGSLALQDGNCPPLPPFVASGFCKTALSLGVPIGLGDDRIAQNAGQEILLVSSEYVLTVNDRLWGHTLTSVTGFYRYHFNETEDTDGTPLSLFNIRAPERYHQLSQELRIASPAHQKLEYLAGAYFHTDRLTYGHDNSYFFLTPQLAAAAPFAPLVPYLPLGQDLGFSQPEKSYSAFESLTWRVADALRLTEGLRASRVQKSYEWSLYYGTAAAAYGSIFPLPAPQAALAQVFAKVAGLGTAGTLQGRRTDNGLMPSAQLQADVMATVMAYASYSRGWKAGGFNGNDTTGIAANLPFAPEHVNAYEVGLKSEWLDRRVRLNIDAFRSDYSDLQVATNVAGSSAAILSLVRNAASSRSEGGELEADWALLDALQLSGNLTYDQSRYLRYPSVAPTQLQQLLGQRSQDLSGLPTEFAPTWSGTLSGRYIVRVSRGCRLTTSVTGIASSGYFLSGNDDPTVEQRGYVRLDARLSLAAADEHWALDLIGKNLTNREVLTFAINWPTATGSTWLQKEETRNLAAQLRLKW